jgi:hypothetical protein
MTTVTLWILLIVPYANRPGVVVDRFATEADCIAVQQHVTGPYIPAQCLRATVVR